MKTHPVPPFLYFLKLCIYPIIFDVLRCTCISIVIVVIKVIMLYTYCLYVLRTNDSAVVFIIFRYFRWILWLPTTSPPLVMACCSCFVDFIPRVVVSRTFFLGLAIIFGISNNNYLLLDMWYLPGFQWLFPRAGCLVLCPLGVCFPGSKIAFEFIMLCTFTCAFKSSKLMPWQNIAKINNQ